MSLPEGERIAILETKVASLESTINSMATDIHAIKEAITQARGGWKTLVALGAIASGLGACFAWIMSHIHFQG